MYSDNSSDTKVKLKKDHDRNLISWWWPIIVLASSCLIFYLIHLQDHVLPPVVTIRESTENPSLFSGERSRDFLRKLTALGPRVVGSKANEIDAPELLERELQKIKNNSQSQTIDIERQKGSGSYQLDEDYVYTNIYNNIQNVIALLRGSSGKHSILFNCHYDSVPTSRGASDDGISCAVMIELLRVLSTFPVKLTHSIIFLFNGAEESSLHGSHLFLNHTWAKNSRIVLNLESAGTGGRVVLFQSGPENAWLFRYFARLAPYPHSQVVGEELFQNDFIPSDTDFRIFRDFGNMPGLDFAFLRNAYLYHTKYDIEEYIPAGSHQHLGDILLAIIKELGHAPELDDMEGNAAGQMVYYDYLGWFMVYYSFEAFIAINIITALLGVLSIVIYIGRLLNWPWLPQCGKTSKSKNNQSNVPFERNFFNTDINSVSRDITDRTHNVFRESVSYNSDIVTMRLGSESAENLDYNESTSSSKAVLWEFLIAIGARLAAQLATFGIGAAVSAIVDAAATLAMPWFANVWLIFPLYWCPCLVVYAIIPWLVDMWREKKRNMSLNAVTQMNLIATQIPWIIIIFVMTCASVRSSVIFMLPVLTSAVANIIIHTTPLYRTARLWLWFYLFIHIFSFLYTMYFSLLVYMLFIPIMGRSGPINGDLYIGIVTVLLCLYISSFAIPLMTLVKKQGITFIFLVIFSIVMIIISLTSSVGLPYRSGPNNPAPQRYWVMHSDRIYYNENQGIREAKSGYFIFNLDRNAPRTVPNFKMPLESLRNDCEEEMYCGLPLYLTRLGLLGERSSWIKTHQPNQPIKTELLLKSRCEMDTDDSMCTLEFDLKGPDRMTLTFAPRDDAELVKWSLETPVQQSGEWKKRPTYFLHIVSGEITGDFPLELTFKVSPEQKDGSPIIDIGLAGNHAHHEENRTSEFQEFIDSFPDWTTVTELVFYQFEVRHYGIRFNVQFKKIETMTMDSEEFPKSEKITTMYNMESKNFDHNKKFRKRKRDRHSVSWLWPLIFLAGGCLLYYIIHIIDYELPIAISADEAIEHPGTFSGERSRESLRMLTNLGPRVVGDIANEVYAPAIIENEVLEAQSNAHSSQSILMKRQKGSGAYFLGFKPGFTNIYNDVQNVLVMLEGSEGEHSILVNCHYDSLPETDGASDDVLTCAIMMELIRVLSKLPVRLKHNVVFLFNGAEETPLEGSHLFLQDEWANKSRIVLNLEAAGQGGRALLFQSGPKNSWLFDYYYQYAPHQHGQIFIEELFQSGFIPSDTDFRIFRDFGNMPGMDFAFGRYGQIYHTKYDIEAYIPAESHQYLGDNILALLRQLGYAPELNNLPAHSEGVMVYYDYLGWFMIAYSVEGGIALNVIGIILAIFSIVIFIGRLLDWSWMPKSMGIVGEMFDKVMCCERNFEETYSYGTGEIRSAASMQTAKCGDDSYNDVIEDIKTDLKNEAKYGNSNHHMESLGEVLLEFAIAVGARILGYLVGIGLTAVFAAIIDSAADLAMPWYSNIWLIFPLYWCPALVACALVVYLVDLWREKKRNISLSTTAQLNLVAMQVPWILALLVLTCAGVRSASVFVFPVYSGAIVNILIHITPLYKTVHAWVWVHLILHIPSLVLTMYTTLLVYVMLVPIAARSGVINGDLYMGVVTAFATFYVISFAIPLMSLVRKQFIVLILLILFSIVMIIIALSSSVGFPYSNGPTNPAPQRYWIMHSEREYYNELGALRNRETGYFILNQDRNSPRTVPLKTRSLRSLAPDCETELYCGLPFYMTRMIPLSADSSWVPAPPPYIPFPTELQISGRCANSINSICNMDFSLKGPDRMTVTLSPREGATLVAWSIPTAIKITGEWKGRPFYYLHITRADMKGDYQLRLTFNVTTEQKEGRPILDIGLAGNHAHHVKDRTKEFQDFIDSFPDWTMKTKMITLDSEDLPSAENANTVKIKSINHTRINRKRKHNRHSIHWLWPLLLLALGCLIYYCVHLIDYVLPRVISADEAIENPGLFSGERSQESLKKLTKLGPRVVGDIANEEYAPAFIENEILEAQTNAHSSQSILVKRQKGSGAYYLGFKPGFTNIYNNVQNILVMLEGSQGEHSILINCHYDTVPQSEGGTDDALPCAIMIELIRALSVLPTRLEHNVLFLFNGAEETPLQGSHLFFQDEWAVKSRVFLNLEGAGQGGRALLFQSGPKNSWLFNYYYQHAPHQHGQIFIEELFQSGFIPSDSDFRIFRDFGKIPGMDFAFGRNGQVYHTKYDKADYIPMGSHQHLGDNILGLIKSLGFAPELNDLPENTDGEIVYYDYLGWFMIFYSVEGGIALNVIGIIISIFGIVMCIGRLLDWSWMPKSMGIIGKIFNKMMCCKRKSDEDAFRENQVVEDIKDDLKSDAKYGQRSHHIESLGAVLLEFFIAVGARFLGFVVAILITAAVAAIIDSAAELAMPWYSNVWLIFPLYWCPAIIINAFIVYLVDLWREKKRNISPSTTAQLNIAAMQVPWILALLILTCAGVRSASVFIFPVYSGAIVNILIHITPLYKTVHKWLWVYLILHIPSMVFTMYITLLVYVMLVPIAARSGVINGDLYIGVVTAIATFYVTSFAIPLMSLVRKQFIALILLTLFSIVMIIIALSSSVGFPYTKGPTDPAPQRYWIMHSEREYYNASGALRNRETGYFILNLDRNSPRTVPLKTRTLRSLEPDCETELYCGLPFYMSRMIPLSADSSWVPAPAPYQPFPTELRLFGRCLFSTDSTCNMEFTLKGPDRMTVTFSPREGASLFDWNIPTAIKTTGEWKGRPFYYLHIVRGEIRGDYQLRLTFNVSNT
ncbi:uncharacterized protein LOC143912654 [Arctopsyche grandis]|uniref:uncharacterized protein LOC143912654 n=1 Tax=Arctopsyche grandis TaxID=121162 RepID=UPI00406D9EB8